MGQVFHFAYLISDTNTKTSFKSQKLYAFRSWEEAKPFSLWKNIINSDGRLLTSVQRISWIKNKNALRLM